MPWLLYAQKRDLVPTVHKARWTPGLVWTGAENLTLTEIQSQTIQLELSCYTDYATQAHINLVPELFKVLSE
jgi:hypothetical protein